MDEKSFQSVTYYYIVAIDRRSKGSHFHAKLRIDKNGFGSIAVPPHVIEKENLRPKDKVEFRIESIKE